MRENTQDVPMNQQLMMSSLSLVVIIWNPVISFCMYETHRSYYALQYSIIFWQGKDDYHFSIKIMNLLTGAQMNKKISSMNYYSNRLMILNACSFLYGLHSQ